MKKLFCLILLVFCFTTINAIAEDFPAGGITPKEMADILIEKGYRAEIHYPDNTGNETYISSSTQGKKFSIYFYDLSDDKRAQSIQYCISFKASEKVDSDAVLDWNANFRYARMYLNKNNSSFFEMDRDVSSGLTKAAIINDLERWDSLVNTIVIFLDKKNTSKDTKS